MSLFNCVLFSCKFFYRPINFFHSKSRLQTFLSLYSLLKARSLYVLQISELSIILFYFDPRIKTFFLTNVLPTLFTIRHAAYSIFLFYINIESIFHSMRLNNITLEGAKGDPATSQQGESLKDCFWRGSRWERGGQFQEGGSKFLQIIRINFNTGLLFELIFTCRLKDVACLVIFHLCFSLI